MLSILTHIFTFSLGAMFMSILCSSKIKEYEAKLWNMEVKIRTLETKISQISA